MIQKQIESEIKYRLSVLLLLNRLNSNFLLYQTYAFLMIYQIIQNRK